MRSLAPFLDRHPDDAARLLLGLRMLFEARSARLTAESLDADRARFDQWAQAYDRAGGQERDLVAAWRKIFSP